MLLYSKVLFIIFTSILFLDYLEAVSKDSRFEMTLDSQLQHTHIHMYQGSSHYSRLVFLTHYMLTYLFSQIIP